MNKKATNKEKPLKIHGDLNSALLSLSKKVKVKVVSLEDQEKQKTLTTKK